MLMWSVGWKDTYPHLWDEWCSQPRKPVTILTIQTCVFNRSTTLFVFCVKQSVRCFLDLYHRIISNSTEQRLMCYEHDSPEAEILRLPATFHVRTLQSVKNSPLSFNWFDWTSSCYCFVWKNGANMLWTFLKIRLRATGKTKHTVLPVWTKHSVMVNCEKLGLCILEQARANWVSVSDLISSAVS